MKNIILCSFIFAIMSCGAKDTTAPVQKASTNVNQQATQPTPKRANSQVAKANIPQTKRTSNAVPQNEYKPKNEGWYVNLDKAFAESKKTGKPIMANFTGSDWCGWCKRLDKAVFHQPGFKDWADENVVLLELDFPRRFRLPANISKQNRGLAQSLGVRGYPTIWVFDIDKDDSGRFSIKALGKTGYTKTLREFTQTVDTYVAQSNQS